MGKYIPVEPEKWAEMVKAMAEVTRLKAEVERLQHLANQSEFYRSQLQKDTCRLENIQMQDAFKHYEAENRLLKAEVERLKMEESKLLTLCETYEGDLERLRNAGDAMAEEIIGCYNAEGYDPADSESLRAWNAAKEGKQP